jgi:signal peptidase II
VSRITYFNFRRENGPAGLSDKSGPARTTGSHTGLPPPGIPAKLRRGNAMTTDTLDKPLPSRRALFVALAAAILILAADQLTKYLVVVVMNLRETGEVHVFPGLNFRMAWNTGVNFGLLSGGGESTRYILASGAGLASVGLIIGAMFSRRMLSAFGLGIAAGGAVGNAIDRFNWGAVADFINLSCCGIHNPWSFNVADIAIFVGFGLLLLPMFRRPAPEAPSTPS